MTHSGRWDDLAADLAGQADAWEVQQRADEIAERMRHEIGRLRMMDRLRPALGSPLLIRAEGQLSVRGLLSRVVADGLVIEERDGRECVVLAARVIRIAGLGRLAEPPDSAPDVDGRLGVRQLLRAVARDRSAVQLHLTDASTADGTLDRVGADFVELASHAPGEARRRGAVRAVELLPLDAIVALRRSRS
jgi:hypothetical protein